MTALKSRFAKFNHKGRRMSPLYDVILLPFICKINKKELVEHHTGRPANYLMGFQALDINNHPPVIAMT